MTLLWVVGAAVLALIVVGVVISNLNKEHKAAKQLAAQLCAASSADSGTAVIAAPDVPKDVNDELMQLLDRLNDNGRRIVWRKSRKGDSVICEMKYCYSGVYQNRPRTVCTDWYATQ